MMAFRVVKLFEIVDIAENNGHLRLLRDMLRNPVVKIFAVVQLGQAVRNGRIVNSLHNFDNAFENEQKQDEMKRHRNELFEFKQNGLAVVEQVHVGHMNHMRAKIKRQHNLVLAVLSDPRID